MFNYIILRLLYDIGIGNFHLRLDRVCAWNGKLSNQSSGSYSSEPNCGDNRHNMVDAIISNRDQTVNQKKYPNHLYIVYLLFSQPP